MNLMYQCQEKMAQMRLPDGLMRMEIWVQLFSGSSPSKQ
jgi:hypothetical protein